MLIIVFKFSISIISTTYLLGHSNFFLFPVLETTENVASPQEKNEPPTKKMWPSSSEMSAKIKYIGKKKFRVGPISAGRKLETNNNFLGSYK